VYVDGGHGSFEALSSIRPGVDQLQPAGSRGAGQALCVATADAGRVSEARSGYGSQAGSGHELPGRPVRLPDDRQHAPVRQRAQRGIVDGAEPECGEHHARVLPSLARQPEGQAVLRRSHPRPGPRSRRGRASRRVRRRRRATTWICGASATNKAESWSTSWTRHCRIPTHRLPSASCRTGTPTCSSTLGGRGCCRNPSDHASSRPRTPSRSARTWSMARWPAPGHCATGRSSWTPSPRRPPRCSARSNKSGRHLRPSTPDRCAVGVDPASRTITEAYSRHALQDHP